MAGPSRRAAGVWLTLVLTSYSFPAPAQQPAAPQAPAGKAQPASPPGASPSGAAPPSQPPPLPPPDQSADLYRQHMDVGISLYEQKNYVAAIAEFQEAYKARPKASPLLNIALCHKAMFAYPKAIKALEDALAKHPDTMDENDRTAANTEIEEMRALLSYVTFRVTPAQQITVQIDGEVYPEAAQGKPVPLSPGPHLVKVSADGYAAAEQTVTLASGNRQLEYALRPNMGFVKITAASPKYAIAVDQKALDYGQWSGLLPPGPHIIDMYVPGSPAPPYRVRLDVEVGKAYEVSPGKGGVPLLGTGLVTPAPPLFPTPRPPSPPIRGPFFLATISFFAPTEQPAAFNGEELSPGVSAGIRGGYRVNTPVSFDAMLEYSNVLVRKAVDQDVSYNLEQFRAGLNMRLQTPGKAARFYGNFGGGFVWQSLEFNHVGAAGLARCVDPLRYTPITPECEDREGYDGYFLIEGGLQLTLGGVLVDAGLGTYLQSTRGFGKGTYKDWLPVLQGGLRVGYGFW